jgi:hypothetical protein
MNTDKTAVFYQCLAVLLSLEFFAAAVPPRCVYLWLVMVCHFSANPKACPAYFTASQAENKPSGGTSSQ